ncbi:unnamed protein product [Hermetia illucens]|uniref:Uncharacterized protein n=1 Tax=Hermetia illucens TaxID=343691 RepID=A0A7R8Z0I2_HERIL|nr:unnamed protein product [Hermetia illucens]
MHDNARSHFHASVLFNIFGEYGSETRPRAVYSPDTSPPDYDLFQKLKEPMKGVRFTDFTAFNDAVSRCIRELNFNQFLNGFAHHLAGMHGHIHAPDWRALGANPGIGRPAGGFPHGAQFFHHQHAPFPPHMLATTLDRPGLRSISENHHLSQLSQLSLCNPHSTTSPKESPLASSLSRATPPHSVENDNNNNIDAGFESDNISVTGSPRKSSSLHDDEDKRSPSPPTGAFTSLIQRNNALRKGDLFSGFASQFQQPHVFNHALAAQLFLQNPLIPQPSQWLYTQLYGNYHDFPWFRNSSTSNNIQQAPLNPEQNNNETSGVNLVKRSVTLISHSEKDNESENQNSPPVTSTRRSPSPEENEEKVCGKAGSLGAIRSRTPKHTDVWRPY